MKTTTLLQTLTFNLKTVIIGLVLVTSTLNASAQTPYLSLVVARDVSGSGLGGNVCPALSLTYNRSTFSVGPNFQRRTLNLSGVQGNYRFRVATNYNKRLELYFSGNVTVHKGAYMSLSNVEIETASHDEETYNYEELRLNVVEAYTGIGLKVNATKNLSAGFSAGMGMFDTLNKNYDREMYREKTAVALQLRFMVSYSFKTW